MVKKNMGSSENKNWVVGFILYSMIFIFIFMFIFIFYFLFLFFFLLLSFCFIFIFYFYFFFPLLGAAEGPGEMDPGYRINQEE